MTVNSSSLGSGPPLPLTVGNVITLGFHLYRQHVKTYFQLAGEAYLWLFVPVYGWAQFFLLSALISRLAYRQLINQPESVTTGKAALRPQRWSFFGLACLIGLIILGAYIAAVLVGAMIAVVLGFAVIALLVPLLGEEVGGLIGMSLVGIILVSALIAGLLWLGARVFIPETVLAIEGQTDAGRGLGRSWQLTQKSGLRVSLILSIAFLLVLPIAMLTNYVPSIYLAILGPDHPLYWLLYMISLALSIAGGIAILPLWQCIKAVVYYDLRMRQEGMDLVIRDRGDRPPSDRDLTS